MAAYAWVFKYGTVPTIFTTDVLSFNGNYGRQNYNDNYAGGSFSITIKNNTNQSASFPRGTEVVINFPTGNTAFYGTVSNIGYNDYPGDTGLSTATITCIDEISRAGKFQLKDFIFYLADQTIQQAIQTNETFTGYKTPEVLNVAGLGNSNASGVASYSGTMLNRLNLLVQTEKGLLSATNFGIYFFSRGSVASTASATSLTRDTVSATTIAYESFNRVALGDNFANQVTVTPESVAEQQVNNTDSQFAYGVAGYSISTVDSSTTQASGLASWLANMQGDPNTLRYEVTFTDVANNSTAFENLLLDVLVFSTVLIPLQWQAQGQSLQTVNTIIEGMSFTGTPSQTSITFYLSPAEYYQYFTLNSDTFGILGGTGITYNQPEIVYDENGWIYNDANADDTASRLGW
jgi:hypothetical protein